MKKNGIDTSTADKSMFGGVHEQMVLRQLEMLDDSDDNIEDDYQQLVSSPEPRDQTIDNMEVKTFTIDTVFN